MAASERPETTSEKARRELAEQYGKVISDETWDAIQEMEKGKDGVPECHFVEAHLRDVQEAAQKALRDSPPPAPVAVAGAEPAAEEQKAASRTPTPPLDAAGERKHNTPPLAAGRSTPTPPAARSPSAAAAATVAADPAIIAAAEAARAEAAQATPPLSHSNNGSREASRSNSDANEEVKKEKEEKSAPSAAGVEKPKLEPEPKLKLAPTENYISRTESENPEIIETLQARRLADYRANLGNYKQAINSLVTASGTATALDLSALNKIKINTLLCPEDPIFLLRELDQTTTHHSTDMPKTSMTPKDAKKITKQPNNIQKVMYETILANLAKAITDATARINGFTKYLSILNEAKKKFLAQDLHALDKDKAKKESVEFEDDALMEAVDLNSPEDAGRNLSDQISQFSNAKIQLTAYLKQLTDFQLRFLPLQQNSEFLTLIDTIHRSLQSNALFITHKLAAISCKNSITEFQNRVNELVAIYTIAGNFPSTLDKLTAMSAELKELHDKVETKPTDDIMKALKKLQGKFEKLLQENSKLNLKITQYENGSIILVASNESKERIDLLRQAKAYFDSALKDTKDNNDAVRLHLRSRLIRDMQALLSGNATYDAKTSIRHTFGQIDNFKSIIEDQTKIAVYPVICGLLAIATNKATKIEGNESKVAAYLKASLHHTVNELLSTTLPHDNIKDLEERTAALFLQISLIKTLEKKPSEELKLIAEAAEQLKKLTHLPEGITAKKAEILSRNLQSAMSSFLHADIKPAIDSTKKIKIADQQIDITILTDYKTQIKAVCQNIEITILHAKAHALQKKWDNLPPKILETIVDDRAKLGTMLADVVPDKKFDSKKIENAFAEIEKKIEKQQGKLDAARASTSRFGLHHPVAAAAGDEADRENESTPTPSSSKNEMR